MVRAKSKKRDWRKFMTEEERKFIAESDNLAATIEAMRTNYERRYTRERALIVNRCVQRAKKSDLKPEEKHG
jgi:hypothetical protein